MEHIKTIETVRLHTGMLELTEAQANPRKHLLTPVLDENGKHAAKKYGNKNTVELKLYEIKDTVTFKAGEVFGYAGEIKSISNKVVDAATEVLMAEVLMERKLKARAAEAKTEEAKAKKTEKPIDPQNVIDIIDVIDALDRDKDFTEGGKPEVKAIEALLDRNVTAAERDAAWAEYQKTQE